MSVVRAATGADLAAVLLLQHACHLEAHLESEACLRSMLERGCSLVAVSAGADAAAPPSTLGYLLLHEGAEAALDAVLPPPSVRLPHASMFLHDCAVSPAARGTGVARQLVEAALALASSRGARDVHLVALAGTHGLWTRLGFEPAAGSDAASYGPEATHMRKQLAV